MQTSNFTIATAGHVDHGKSSLVKALTGTDPDRLPEEKARGMTVDLGFAHLRLRSPSDASLLFDVGIIDVPGHEDLVNNMVSGVGSIDLALFVIAADDGWMPQTEEHLQIVTYLGVREAVVALTKVDLLEFVEGTAIQQIRDKLLDTPFKNAPIVGTSVVTGRGIEELKDALCSGLQGASTRMDIGKPRLPVDRAFTLRGIGTVVTGTLTGGNLQRNQEVVVWPSGRRCRIRGVQSYGCQLELGSNGARTALNLSDLVISKDPKNGVQRGSVVTTLALGKPTYTLDVLLYRSGRLDDRSKGAAGPKSGVVVRWLCGTANTPARLLLLDCEKLVSGAQVVGQLRFASPVFVLAGERFILRDWPERITLAGGIVLDAHANRRGFRSDSRKRFLEQRADSPDNVLTFVDSQIGRDKAVHRSSLLVKSLFSAEAISQAVLELANHGKVSLAGDLVVEAKTWAHLSDTMVRAIDEEHQTHPERVGLALADLRTIIRGIAPLPDLVDALISAHCVHDFQTVGLFIRRVKHQPKLPRDLRAAGERVRFALTNNPVAPPSRNQLAPDESAKKALRFLLETGEAIEIDKDIVVSLQGFHQMVNLIEDTLRELNSATVSELCKAIGTSRRIGIPLLEFLDRAGVTQRRGDKRTLRDT